MLLFIIRLKNGLNKDYLSGYITKFSKLTFNARFVKVQLKFKSIDDQTYLIGNQHILDLENPQTIKSFKLMSMDFYSRFETIPHISIIKYIIFEYEELDRIN